MGIKLNVGLLFGGRSVEHDISVISARNIFENIDKDIYKVHLIGIDTKGRWFFHKQFPEDITQGSPLQLNLTAEKSPFIVDNKAIEIDVIFPILHGTDGEDGSIQGLLKAMNIPCAGSTVLGSSVAMNKLTSKNLLLQAGIPVSKHLAYNFHEKGEINYDYVREKLGSPVIIKPTSLGSSVGVSKANNAEEFKAAIADTFTYDNELIIEEFIQGRELELAILGNENAKTTVPGEVIISSNYDFYSFDAKYVDSEGSKTIIPAPIDNNIIEKMKEICIKSYHALHCSDFSRVDLFLTEDGKIYINEINTLPGFTNVSMFPKLWEHEGIAYKDLLSSIIEFALARYKQEQRVVTDFDSTLL